MTGDRPQALPETWESNAQRLAYAWCLAHGMIAEADEHEHKYRELRAEIHRKYAMRAQLYKPKRRR
jgi:hypothetical protein